MIEAEPKGACRRQGRMPGTLLAYLVFPLQVVMDSWCCYHRCCCCCSVCDNRWDDLDASVACAQLGYTYGTALNGSGTPNGPNGMRTWLSLVNCGWVAHTDRLRLVGT